MSTLAKNGKKRNWNPSSPNSSQVTIVKQYKKPNKRSTEEVIYKSNISDYKSDISPKVSSSPRTTNTFVRMADLTNFGAIPRNCLLKQEIVRCISKNHKTSTGPTDINSVNSLN